MTPIAAIIRAVAEAHGLTPDDLTGPSRHRIFSHPRQDAMRSARILTDASLPAIGRAFGGRHHATVLHGIRASEDRMPGIEGTVLFEKCRAALVLARQPEDHAA